MWEVLDTQGATAFGSHFLSTWDSCQRKWFLKQLVPHPTGGTGLKSKFTAEPLFTGWLSHQWLAAWYLTLGKFGKPILGAAEKILDESAKRREWEVEPKVYEDSLAMSRLLLYHYHEKYSRGVEDLQVVLDGDGEPVVEREYKVDLGEGYVFTCRVDALVLYKQWLYVLEHKTTSASGVGRLQRTMRLDIQASGECFILHKLFPDQEIAGVMLNMLVKNPGKKIDRLIRDPIPRTRMQTHQFEMDTQRKLKQIHEQRTEYEALVKEGIDPWEAGRAVFPLTGASHGHCHAYFRECEFLDLCQQLGNEQNLVSERSHIPNTPPEPEHPDGSEAEVH